MYVSEIKYPHGSQTWTVEGIVIYISVNADIIYLAVDDGYGQLWLEEYPYRKSIITEGREATDDEIDQVYTLGQEQGFPISLIGV